MGRIELLNQFKSKPLDAGQRASAYFSTGPMRDFASIAGPAHAINMPVLGNDTSTLFRDEFTGPDGASPNPAYWQEVDNDNGDAKLANNEFNYNSTDPARLTARFDSIFKMSGEFMVEIDWNIYNLTTPTAGVTHGSVGETIAAWIGTSNSIGGSKRTWCYRGRNKNGSDLFFCKTNATSGGSPIYPGAINISKFRMSRTLSPNRFHLWYWAGGIWQWDGNPAGVSRATSDSGNVNINLYWNKGDNGELNCSFDNFKVIQGTLVWP